MSLIGERCKTGFGKFSWKEEREGSRSTRQPRQPCLGPDRAESSLHPDLNTGVWKPGFETFSRRQELTPCATCLGHMTRVLFGARERRRRPNPRLSLGSSGRQSRVRYGAQHHTRALGGGDTLQKQSGSSAQPRPPHPRLSPEGRRGRPRGLLSGFPVSPSRTGLPRRLRATLRPEALTRAARGQPERPTTALLGAEELGRAPRVAPGACAPGPVPDPPSPRGAQPCSPGPHSTALTSRRPTTPAALPRSRLPSGPPGFPRPRARLALRLTPGRGAAPAEPEAPRPGYKQAPPSPAPPPRPRPSRPLGPRPPQPRPTPAPSRAPGRRAGSP